MSKLDILMQRQCSQKSSAFLLPFSPLLLCRGPHRYHALASSQEVSHRHHFAPLVPWWPPSCLRTSLSPSPAASQSTAGCCLLSRECCLHWGKQTEPVTGTVSGIVHARKTLHQDSAMIFSFLEHHQATKCSGSCLSLQREAAIPLQ